MLFASACLGITLATTRAPEALHLNTRAEYIVLSAKAGELPPFESVSLAVGPIESIDGKSRVWWELDIHGKNKADSPSVMRLHVLSDAPLFRSDDRSITPQRYQLEIPDTHEQLEYLNSHTNQAILPPWDNFQAQFFPVAAGGCEYTRGFPQTCRFLGHVLTLREVTDQPWKPMTQVRKLLLDPELLIGTARNFKEKENGRLPHPEKQDYTYTPFVESDYAVMLKAGINLYCVTSDQEPSVRDEPAFFLRRPDKKSKKKQEPRFRYPADLYRSNFLGDQMFFDEPAIILTFDEHLQGKIDRSSDAIALMQERIRAGSVNASSMGRALTSDFNLGDLSIVNRDYPSWETLYYTAFYQMEAGLAGFVQEGRYRLDGFDERLARWTGQSRKHTVDEMIRYYYAFLRGGTRPFDKSWGAAIYGQADPAVTPRAVQLAYDMGARYIWFWTSDHEHHLPWGEQVQLAQTVCDYAKLHPRESIVLHDKQIELAIVVPYGTFLSLDEIKWIRDLKADSKSDSRAKFERVMRRAHIAIDEALQTGTDFDITVDNGPEIKGYRKIVRISDLP